MGKNTMMKRSIREYVKRTGNKEWEVSSERPGARVPSQFALRSHVYVLIRVSTVFAGSR